MDFKNDVFLALFLIFFLTMAMLNERVPTTPGEHRHWVKTLQRSIKKGFYKKKILFIFNK